MRKLISTGSSFEKSGGYSRAVVQGDWCFVSGTTGYDYETMIMPKSIEEQTRNIFATISKTLKEASFTMADIVRIQIFLTEPSDTGRVFPIMGEILGDIRPAATMVICDLIRPEMLVEIEVTALKSSK